MNVSVAQEPPADARPAREGSIALIWRRRWIVLATTFLALIVSIVYLATATPIYRAGAQLALASAENEGPVAQSAAIHAHAESIRSAEVLGAVLEAPVLEHLGLAHRASDPVGHLKQLIRVEVSPDARSLEVWVEDSDPRAAAQIVNTVIDVQMSREALRQTQADPRIASLRQRREELLDRRHKAQQALSEFRNAHPDFAASDPEKAARDRVTKLTDARTNAELEALAARASYEESIALLDDPDKVRALVDIHRLRGIFGSIDRETDQMRRELQQAEAQLARQLETMGMQNPAVKQTQLNIEQLRVRIDQQIPRYAAILRTHFEQSWRAAERKQRDIEHLLEDARRRLDEIASKHAEHTRLEDARREVSDELASVEQQIKDARLLGQVLGSGLRIERPADVPDRPHRPDRAQVLLYGLVVGLLCGLVAASVRGGTTSR